MLHDVLDDTSCTPQQLQAAFGAEVLALVVSVTRLSQVSVVVAPWPSQTPLGSTTTTRARGGRRGGVERTQPTQSRVRERVAQHTATLGSIAVSVLVCIRLIGPIAW